MFKFIRVQILYPCQAKCAWCSTHRKNPLFGQLYRHGISEQIHQFYVDIIRHLQPDEVFISGGEPLLYPEIAWFLNAIKDSTQRIQVFTSYQYSETARYNIPFGQMPLDKVTLNHTLLYFDPQPWHKLTAGFPFDLYATNIQAMIQVPVRKRFKFIVNHVGFSNEIQRFQQRIVPDHNCELSFKVINDQGNGLNKSSIQQTKQLVNERIQSLEQLVAPADWGQVSRKEGSLEMMAPLLENGDVQRCPYRQDPIELRLAFYKARDDHQVLKYRYCPYFPAHVGYRFHIGRDDPQKLEQNYFRGNFRDFCSDCRFLKYAASSS
jgi:organic radical activating enzyme